MKLNGLLIEIIVLQLRFIVAGVFLIFGLFSPQKAQYGKRLMFLTSIYAALVKEGILQEMSIESFNSTFLLVEDVAILDATVIANNCWNKVNLKSELSRCMISMEDMENRQDRISIVERFGPRIIELTPKWMRYDNMTMLEDVKDVLLVNGFTKLYKESNLV